MENLTVKSVHYCTIESEFAGMRLDNYLFRLMRKVPKSRIYRALRQGEVRVNKGRKKPDYRLIAGDELRIPPVEKQDTKEETVLELALGKRMLKHIIYEDSGLLIINKPSGVAVHGGSGVNRGLIEALRSARPELKSLELVHRIDRDTSGCLVIAKKRSTLKECHTLLRDQKMDKTYCLLVKGKWPRALREVDAPLHRFETRDGERRVRVDKAGKSACTQFRIVERFSNATLLAAKLLTGRTHQIRVHAMHSGHPIVGDEKYGDKLLNKALRRQGCERLFLHAQAIQFDLPSTGDCISVQADLDSALTSFLKRLK